MWKLTKYARYEAAKTRSKDFEQFDWKYFDTISKPLELILGRSGHLILSHGTTIMDDEMQESYNLHTVKKCMRGQSKGDSMIILYNMQDVSHRFRVKFDATSTETSSEACMDCARNLSKFFSVKVVVNETEPSVIGVDTNVLEGEVTLSQVANVLTGTEKWRLPLLYSTVPTEDISVILKLCLSDPSFPAYVEQVERQINNLKADSSL